MGEGVAMLVLENEERTIEIENIEKRKLFNVK